MTIIYLKQLFSNNNLNESKFDDLIKLGSSEIRRNNILLQKYKLNNSLKTITINTTSFYFIDLRKQLELALVKNPKLIQELISYQNGKYFLNYIT